MSLPSIDSLPPLREVIAHYGLLAKKALGQHFLLDLNLTKRIVKAAGDLSGMTVFEVGPGPGGLTRPLVLSNASAVIAIEKDERCLGALRDIAEASGEKLRIVAGDALKTDLTSLAPAPRAIVANLPYNIGTTLLLGWLKQGLAFESMTFLLQEEVVDRLVAKSGSEAYGRLSIIAQACCEVSKVFTIPARAFTPPPKVESAVVRLVPRQDRPSEELLSALERVTAAAFGQRRKMLRSSLKAIGGEALLLKAGIQASQRAEELDLAAFLRLAQASIEANG